MTTMWPHMLIGHAVALVILTPPGSATKVRIFVSGKAVIGNNESLVCVWDTDSKVTAFPLVWSRDGAMVPASPVEQTKKHDQNQKRYTSTLTFMVTSSLHLAVLTCSTQHTTVKLSASTTINVYTDEQCADADVDCEPCTCDNGVCNCTGIDQTCSNCTDTEGRTHKRQRKIGTLIGFLVATLVAMAAVYVMVVFCLKGRTKQTDTTPVPPLAATAAFAPVDSTDVMKYQTSVSQLTEGLTASEVEPTISEVSTVVEESGEDQPNLASLFSTALSGAAEISTDASQSVIFLSDVLHSNNESDVVHSNIESDVVHSDNDLKGSLVEGQ